MRDGVEALGNLANVAVSAIASEIDCAFERSACTEICLKAENDPDNQGQFEGCGGVWGDHLVAVCRDVYLRNVAEGM